MIPQFIVAFLLACFVMIGGSLLWPKFMKRDRPAVLQAVYEKVIETEAGKKAEDVLGTFTVPENIPQAVSSASSQAAAQAGSTVGKKVEEVVTYRMIEEIVKRFDTLPAQDKEQLKTVICKPSE